MCVCVYVGGGGVGVGVLIRQSGKEGGWGEAA